MRKLLFLLLTFIASVACGQQLVLSPNARISLITCGPSQSELYTAFGHSAIRVVDSVNRIDYAYNYGVFDFDQPNFYLNYTRGLLNFKLGVYHYPDFLNSYMYYNRWVDEQVLDLSATQRQAVFNYLEWNALPENETYLYDYFYNNCANRVRDVFAEVLKDSIHFNGSFITTSYTIRQLTDLYLKEQPWGDLGIDICLGLPMDKKAAPYEYMFIPDYLESSFDHAEVGKAGVWAPLVKTKLKVFTPRQEKTEASIFHPWVAMGSVLALTVLLCVFDWRQKKLSKWFDILLFGSTGLVGCLLVVLWLGTNHQAAANNFNLLWALPTHVFVFAIGRMKSALFLRKYFLCVFALMIIVLATWTILPQEMNIFLMPFVGALLCRSFAIAWLL